MIIVFVTWTCVKCVYGINIYLVVRGSAELTYKIYMYNITKHTESDQRDVCWLYNTAQQGWGNEVCCLWCGVFMYMVVCDI